jgi:AcrR family transcriptional regulator
MARRPAAGLDRAAAPQPRLSREDWLQLALRTLIRDGIDRVRVQVMARELGVARSSFYWFFRDPADLHAQMLDRWLTKNTAPVISRAERPAASIAEAILNVFECWANEDLFDPRLDIAVRLWARRSPEVLRIVEEADARRIDALRGMFARHGFAPEAALVRARVLYFTQIGQYTLDIREDIGLRLERTGAYVRAFCGMDASEHEIARFEAVVAAATLRNGAA